MSLRGSIKPFYFIYLIELTMKISSCHRCGRLAVRTCSKNKLLKKRGLFSLKRAPVVEGWWWQYHAMGFHASSWSNHLHTLTTNLSFHKLLALGDMKCHHPTSWFSSVDPVRVDDAGDGKDVCSEEEASWYHSEFIHVWGHSFGIRTVVPLSRLVTGWRRDI